MSELNLPPPEAFQEFPGMRGLRIARVGQADGRVLEVIEAVKGVVIPMMTHPSREQGRVLDGEIKFMKDGEGKHYQAGDTWEVPAGESQGPHVVMSDFCRVLLLRDGHSAFDGAED
jgi:quercetin dioxygenase-like cupin family protein